MKVIICGGSIAGCAVAAILSRKNIPVKIFERSKHLEDRGAGIALPLPQFETLQQLDLFDRDLSSHLISQRGFYIQDAKGDPKEIWNQKIKLAAVNWRSIYRNLRQRVPDAAYLDSESVLDFECHQNQVTVTTQSGKTSGEFLIAADGVNSFVRRKLFPNTTIDYSGYLCWRGTIPLQDVDLHSMFHSQLNYFFPPDGQQGHLILYLIPSSEPELTGPFIVNWILYEPCLPEKLSTLLVDSEGKSQSISLPKGKLTAEHLAHLYSLSKSYPSELMNIVKKTQAPFLQVIFDSVVPNFVEQRVAFVGDSALTFRPHAGSGAANAIEFGMELAELIATSSESQFEANLTHWNQKRITHARDQLIWSKRLGDALVMKVPDWSSMNQTKMDDWWQQIQQEHSWYVTDHAK